jgi:membrane peptidoglycan carboxypeptidase
MFPKNYFVRTILALFTLSFVFSITGAAQSKRNASQKAVAKKAEKQRRDAKKERDKVKLAARDTKRDKLTARDRRDTKSRAEARRAEAERRREEAERRSAILAERRRREQAAREARARKLAFERGLRTQTIANISNDVTDGEDLSVRQATVNALNGHAGSVVVMEAQTGKILTIVNQDWAVRSGIKPCSTIKLVTGVAGLNEGVIIKEDGSIRNTPTRLNLDDALAFSNNGYFQRVGSNVGNAKMIEYARLLGLGQTTGLNAEGETAGKLPFGNNNARIYSHGDDFEVTPLQLAVMVSAISNGGTRVLPRTPRNEFEKAHFQTFYRQRLDLPQVNVRRVIPGMMGAAEYGTAHRGVDASLGIAGKTGSCRSKGSWVGLFASVAPIEKPKYSVVVITRGQRERGKYAAAVAGQIYKALATKIIRTNRNLAQTEFKLPSRTSLDASTASKFADEENDEESAGETETIGLAGFENEGREVIIVPSAPRQVPVVKSAPRRLVTNTGSSQPLFPPIVITFDRDGKEKKKAFRTKPE